MYITGCRPLPSGSICCNSLTPREHAGRTVVRFASHTFLIAASATDSRGETKEEMYEDQAHRRSHDGVAAILKRKRLLLSYLALDPSASPERECGVKGSHISQPPHDLHFGIIADWISTLTHRVYDRVTNLAEQDLSPTQVLTPLTTKTKTSEEIADIDACGGNPRYRGNVDCALDYPPGRGCEPPKPRNRISKFPT